MKKCLAFFLIVGLTLSGSLVAQSIAQPQATVALHAEEASLTRTYLTGEQLTRFERIAERRWQDFVAYLVAVDNEQYPDDFRTQAERMARGLWVDSMIPPQLRKRAVSENGRLTWGKRFVREGGGYAGMMRLENPRQTPLEFRVTLVRRPKIFGDHEIYVWELAFAAA